MRNLKRVFVHYTGAAATQTVKSIKNYWKQAHPEWGNTPGYHIIVEANGTAHRLQDDERVTYGVANYNSSALHVCFIGDGPMTAAQEATIIKRIHHWLAIYGPLEVLGHRDVSPDKNGDGKITSNEWIKACPGFDVKPWWAKVKAANK